MDELQIHLGSVWGLLRVALVFLWLVWGLLMVYLGFLYMMFLKDYLQYEKQKKGEKQGIGKAGKQRSWKSRKAKSRKAKKQGNRNPKKKRKKIIPKKNNPPNKMVPVTVCLVVVSGLFIPRSKFVV